MASQGIFATGLNCMDGRCQTKAFDYVQSLTGADFVDMITEPGIDGLLAGTHSVVSEDNMPSNVEWIKQKAEISAKGHGSKEVVIFGHCACAGNAVELDNHKDHLRKAKEIVEGWGLFDTVRLAVFNDSFEIEEVV